MKNWKIVLFFCTLLCLLAVFSVGAAAYEPDGSWSEEYLFPASECNRTVYVNCVDKDTGQTVKSVTYHTKRSENDIISLSLNGYDITDFTSNAGLFQSCKLTWASGTGLCRYAYIQIEYEFIGMVSGSSITATVTVRKSAPITLKIHHYVSVDQSHLIFYPDEQREISYYDWVDIRALDISGYHIQSGYASALSGNFSYSWIGATKNIKSDALKYHLVNTDTSVSMDEWSTFHETKQGKLDYCTNRVVTVYFYYAPNEYTVTYHPNGGENAPASQTKYHGVSLTVPETVPTRGGYAFAGWSTNQYANTGSYFPGDPITVDHNFDLYAVWLISEYEFSVYDNSLPFAEVSPGEIVPVSVRTDSWDQVNSYADIPLELYLDGTRIDLTQLNFSPYATVYVTFSLNVGTVAGDHEVEIRLNWEHRQDETDPDNNCVKYRYRIVQKEYEFSIQAMTGTGSYYEGMEVITPFAVCNGGTADITPETVLSAHFTVTDDEGTLLAEETKNLLVIPKNQSNLVYFKWKVPENYAGKTVFCQCSIQTNTPLPGEDETDNCASFSTVIRAYPTSQTPDTHYERTAPAEYAPADPASTEKKTMAWNEWVWENGGFELKRFGITFAEETPVLTPDPACPNRWTDDGIPVMRSGYGISISYSPTVTVLPGFEMPGENAYTRVQAVRAGFPEFGYSTEAGAYRTLEETDDSFSFVENPNDQNQRTHFIPIYVADGDYTVSVTATQVWTPAGVLTATRNTEPVRIAGSLYDDYNIGY